jgi:hypothetical protein
MTAEGRNSGRAAAIARQRRGKHVSAATDADATTEDGVFSMQSVPMLYNEDQLEKPESRQSVRGRSRQFSVLSYIVSSRYLATTSEQTKDLMCAVVVVIYRVGKSVRLL